MLRCSVFDRCGTPKKMTAEAVIKETPLNLGG
jgi:hypothetical protein